VIFLQTLANTTVFGMAHKFLVAEGRADPDLQKFYAETLFTLWYGTYSRCHGKALGSSGWEHVFSGEWKDKIVDGQHNWVRFYLLEKAGKINYHGHYSYEGNLIGTIQYEWEEYLKETGGFFITTSPAFDFAVFTTCVLSEPGGGACRFTVDGDKKIFVTSYQQDCSGISGVCLSTSYPSDH